MRILSTGPIYNAQAGGEGLTRDVSVKIDNRDSLNSCLILLQGFILNGTRTLYVLERFQLSANQVITKEYFANFKGFEFVFTVSGPAEGDTQISLWGKDAAGNPRIEHRLVASELLGSNIGAQGVQGPQGITGVQGPQGETGNQGPQGPQGAAGSQGVQGPQGMTGVQGIQGVQGPQGATGSQGVQGPQGMTGLQGIQGVQGPQGATGGQGVQGPQGMTGVQGVQGPQGATGSQGEQGPQGVSSMLDSAFRATVTAPQRYNGIAIVDYPVVLFDLNEEFTSPNIFRPKQDGIYSICASVGFIWTPLGPDQDVEIYIRIEGRAAAASNRVTYLAGVTSAGVLQVCTIVFLQANDEVYVEIDPSIPLTASPAQYTTYFAAARL